MRGNTTAGELPQLPIPRRPERASELPTSLPASAKAAVVQGKFLPSRDTTLRGRLAHQGRIFGGPEAAEGYSG